MKTFNVSALTGATLVRLHEAGKYNMTALIEERDCCSSRNAT